jgi:hypothetical protein
MKTPSKNRLPSSRQTGNSFPAQCASLLDAKVLLRFARERLCLKVGSSLSIEEIHSAYIEFGQKQGLPVYPRPAFNRELGPVILKVFTKTPSNSLLRPAKGTAKLTNRRGYKGMAFAGALVTSGDSEDSREGGGTIHLRLKV